MREGEQTIALLGALAVVVTTLVMGLDRSPVLPGVDADRPMVGRAAADVAAGPPDAFRGLRKTSDAARESARVEQAMMSLDARCERDPWSRKLVSVVVHPLPAGLPEVEVEEGEPWHFVLGPSGAVAPTERLLRGRAGAPPGVPVEASLRALHIMVPHVGSFSEARRRGLADLIRWLRRRLGRKTSVELASDLSGSRLSLPGGVTRTDLLPEDGR